MCFHNSQTKQAQELKNRYRAELADGYQPQPIYHASAFSYPEWPVITGDSPALIQPFTWGLIPYWCRDAETARKVQAMTHNCRSEDMWEKPSFRAAIAQRRCLIPSTGYYEWQHIKKEKLPHFIHLSSTGLFSMAGIWEQWTDTATGEVHFTYSILTTAANPLMARIHNTKLRMPLILTPEQEHLWLDPALSKEDIDTICHTPYPDADMAAYPISKLITTRGIDTNIPEVMEPVVNTTRDLFN